ncbi:MAG: DUF1579 domain-containing protein [Cyclobacteriaceae bacterium]|jgi:hypothetical protein|nr:DUF1579 domain-containing protein [Cyclobacteriaceae bacterium]
MKNLLVYAFVLLTLLCRAQTSADEMKKLAPLVGQWKGTASYRMGPGEPQIVQQLENIDFRLHGAILQIEGIGTVADRTVHHAMAIVNFDANQKKFFFRSYLSDGKMADADFQVTAEGVYTWGFDYPGRKMRYRITIVGNQWTETGDYSSDGTQWTRFIDMNLTKQ